MNNPKNSLSFRSIQKLIEVVEPVVTKEQRQLIFPVPFIFWNVLERTLHSLVAVTELIEGYKPAFYNSICLTLRSILSDFLALAYPLEPSITDSEIEKRIYDLYIDDYKKTKNHIDSPWLSKYFTREQIDQVKSDMENPNSIMGILKKEMDRRTGSKASIKNTRQVLDFYHEHYKDHILTNRIIKAYEMWKSFSASEHLGWNSYGLTRDRSFQKVDSDVCAVVKIAYLLSANCLLQIEEEDAQTRLSENYRSLFPL